MKKKYNNKETLDETYEIDYDLFTVEEIIKIIQFYQLMGQYKNNKVSKQKIKEAYLEYKNIINQLDKEQLEEEIKVPENLNSVLRYYQKTGFKWLKILDRYHFGGILADDMGLRKNYSNVISNS